MRCYNINLVDYISKDLKVVLIITKDRYIKLVY